MNLKHIQKVLATAHSSSRVAGLEESVLVDVTDDLDEATEYSKAKKKLRQEYTKKRDRMETQHHTKERQSVSNLADKAGVSISALERNPKYKDYGKRDLETLYRRHDRERQRLEDWYRGQLETLRRQYDVKMESIEELGLRERISISPEEWEWINKQEELENRILKALPDYMHDEYTTAIEDIYYRNPTMPNIELKRRQYDLALRKYGRYIGESTEHSLESLSEARELDRARAEYDKDESWVSRRYYADKIPKSEYKAAKGKVETLYSQQDREDRWPGSSAYKEERTRLYLKYARKIAKVWAQLRKKYDKKESV